MNEVFIYRLIVCYILSILIGVERLYRNKATGLRTNDVVTFR